MTTGERIRAVLKERAMYVKDLAKAVGLSPQAMAQIVNGSRPGTKRLPMIADALGVSLHYLTTGGVAEPSTPYVTKSTNGPQDTRVNEGEPSNTTTLPLVGEAAAADSEDVWSDIVEMEEAKNLQLKGNLIVVKIRGRSAYPVIFPGQFALVDMDRVNNVDNKNIVVVFNGQDQSRCMVKRYVEDKHFPGGFALVSVNIGSEVYAATELPPDYFMAPVVGVLFSHAFKGLQDEAHEAIGT
jgi:transcriptional regulator with XRE-family HTH domain